MLWIGLFLVISCGCVVLALWQFYDCCRAQFRTTRDGFRDPTPWKWIGNVPMLILLSLACAFIAGYQAH